MQSNDQMHMYRLFIIWAVSEYALAEGEGVVVIDWLYQLGWRENIIYTPRYRIYMWVKLNFNHIQIASDTLHLWLLNFAQNYIMMSHK
jgi:hypothetical protein